MSKFYSQLIRLAATLPKSTEGRPELLNILKEAASKREIVKKTREWVKIGKDYANTLELLIEKRIPEGAFSVKVQKNTQTDGSLTITYAIRARARKLKTAYFDFVLEIDNQGDLKKAEVHYKSPQGGSKTFPMSTKRKPIKLAAKSRLARIYRSIDFRGDLGLDSGTVKAPKKEKPLREKSKKVFLLPPNAKVQRMLKDALDDYYDSLKGPEVILYDYFEPQPKGKEGKRSEVAEIFAVESKSKTYNRVPIGTLTVAWKDFGGDRSERIFSYWEIENKKTRQKIQSLNPSKGLSQSNVKKLFPQSFLTGIFEEKRKAPEVWVGRNDLENLKSKIVKNMEAYENSYKGRLRFYTSSRPDRDSERKGSIVRYTEEYPFYGFDSEKNNKFFSLRNNPNFIPLGTFTLRYEEDEDKRSNDIGLISWKIENEQTGKTLVGNDVRKAPSPSDFSSVFPEKETLQIMKGYYGIEEEVSMEGRFKGRSNEIIDFVDDISYMTLLRDDGDEIVFQTRENGNNWSETPGRQDQAHAESIKKDVLKKFSDMKLKVNVDSLDEWTLLVIQ